MLGACADVRIERVGTDDDEGNAAGEAAPPRSAGRALRGCDGGAPIVQESFAKAAWPAAWLPGGEGQSWVEDHAGFLRADAGASHSRTIHAAFGDIDVAVRWQASSEQAFRLRLRDGAEDEDAVFLEGHGVGDSGQSQWLRARIFSELGTTRLEAHEWLDGDPEPEEWSRSASKSVGPVGTFALSTIEQGGTHPVRVEEVVICPLAIGGDT